MPDSTAARSASAALTQILPTRARELILRLAPYLLLLGLLVLCGYLAARLSWQFAAPTATGASAPTGTGAQGGNGAGGETTGERIAAAHLFGTAAAPAATAAARNAPETSLDLGLAGVAAASGGTQSYAIIRGDDHHENTYAVGAKLPGGVLVRQILPDRIILAHDGRLETLRLPNTATSVRATATSSRNNGAAQPGPLTRPQHAPRPPGETRWKLVTNPKGLAQYMRLRPYSSGGQIQGYKVYPGKSPELFRKAGLKSGDVITSVNGVSLDNPAGIKQAITQMRKSKGPVRIVVLRDNHKLHLTVNFGG